MGVFPKIKIMKAVLVFVLLACILGTFASDFYISSSAGNNSWSGEEDDEPVQTLAQALGLAMNDSDSSVTFHIFPGNYAGNENLGLNYDGFDSVEFEVYMNGNTTGAVVIDCSQSAALNGFNFNGTVDISFNGENATDDGMSYFQISDCTAAVYVVNTTSVTVQFENMNISGCNYGVKSDATSTFRFIEFDDSVVSAQTLAVDATSDGSDNSHVQLTQSMFTSGGINVANFDQGIIKETNITGNPQNKILIPFATIVGGTWDFDDVDVYGVSAGNNSPFTISNATLNVYESSFTQCSNDNNGGCFSVTDTAFLVNVTDFVSCSSNGNGGAVYQTGSIGVAQYEQVNFIGCSATNYGGALYLDNMGNRTYFEDVSFVNDTALRGGNAIACCENTTSCSASTTLEVRNSTLTVSPATGADITCKMAATNSSGFTSEYTTASPYESSTGGTPWWVWLILGLIVLAIIIAVIAGIGYFVYQKKRAGYSTVE